MKTIFRKMTIDNELVNLCIDESPPRNKPLVAKYLRLVFIFFSFHISV